MPAKGSGRNETLIRGKYRPSRFPMLVENPDIDPGEYWGKKPVPEGFKLDKGGRIWPVAVKKGRVAPPEKRCPATGRDGEQCPNYKMVGKELCRMHGAKQRTGIAHPRTITGEQCRNGIFGDALPKELSEWYSRAIDDPEIMDLTHNIAVLTGLERELMQGMSTGESKAAWHKAEALCDKLFAAIHNQDEEAIGDHLQALRDCIKTGRNDSDIRAELLEIGEKKRRLLDSERKRRVDLKAFVSAEQLRNLLRSFTRIVFEEIHNLPALIQALVKKDGRLDTGRLSMAMISRIGARMGAVSQGMKSGKIVSED